MENEAFTSAPLRPDTFEEKDSLVWEIKKEGIPILTEGSNNLQEILEKIFKMFI